MNINKTQVSENINTRVTQLKKNEKNTYREGQIYEEILERIPERKPVVNNKRKGNRLLFGVTVTTLTAIMAGTVFYAMHQNQPKKNSIQSMHISNII